jgi:hypothetical protein
MFTHTDEINKVCTHREYFGQFVSPAVKQIVKNHIGEKAIKESKDEHFNDIELSKWDRLYPSIMVHCLGKLKLADSCGGSLADAVCIAKEAARQIKEGK